MVARHRSERYFFTARSIVKNYFDHTAIAGKDNRLTRLRLIVRQVNEDTTPTEPSAVSGIGELDLTFKTV